MLSHRTQAHTPYEYISHVLNTFESAPFPSMPDSMTTWLDSKCHCKQNSSSTEEKKAIEWWLYTFFCSAALPLTLTITFRLNNECRATTSGKKLTSSSSNLMLVRSFIHRTRQRMEKKEKKKEHGRKKREKQWEGSKLRVNGRIR